MATIVNKKNVGLALAILVLICAYFLPVPPGLTKIGLLSLALMGVGLILWVCETFPVAITGLLLMILMPLMGILDLNASIQGFISPVIFFAIASFSLTVILLKTKLALRITGAMLRWSKDSSTKLVLAFMIGVALLSAIMSNLPSVLIFISLAFSVLKPLNAKPGESNLGKCLMIGIPIAAGTGGFATPAGSAINLMAINMLEQVTGGAMTVTFLNWMLIGIPVAAIMIVVEWFFLTRILKPEKISMRDLDSLKEEINSAGPMETIEKKVILVIFALLALWIAGTWVPFLNTTLVAVLGLIFMFLPGVNMLTWDEFQKAVPWNIILMIGTVQAVAAGIMATGAADWMAAGVMNMTSAMSVWGILLVISAFVVLLHAVFPQGPAIIGMLVVPLAGIAMTTGLFSPVTTTMIVAIGVGISYILPINPVVMMSYNYGYYKFTDVIKTGAVPTVVFIAILAFWTPLIISLLGL